jgi:hypothetical protein
MANPKKTLYQILGVTPEASSIDIGLAHEKKAAEAARAMPPDPSAVALVQQAYEILSNPHRRAAYDSSLVTATEKLAAQQQAPDLELEPEETEDDDRSRKMRLLGMVGVMALVFVALFFVFRPRPVVAPPPEAVAEAPKPVPPPAPKPRTGAGSSTTSRRRAPHHYSMSGSATPVGVGLEVELGQMITTCHALPAGEKLVVKVGGQMQAAELTIVDEELDLCRLLVPGFTTPPLRLAAEDAKAGDKIYAIAPNAKGEFAATEGTIKQVRTTPLGKVLEVSMPIAANGSGGGCPTRWASWSSYRAAGFSRPEHRLAVSWIARRCVAILAANEMGIASRFACSLLVWHHPPTRDDPSRSTTPRSWTKLPENPHRLDRASHATVGWFVPSCNLARAPAANGLCAVALRTARFAIPMQAGSPCATDGEPWGRRDRGFSATDHPHYPGWNNPYVIVPTARRSPIPFTAPTSDGRGPGSSAIPRFGCAVEATSANALPARGSVQ